eukprot:2491582-Rhodomonas_salina.1
MFTAGRVRSPASTEAGLGGMMMTAREKPPLAGLPVELLNGACCGRAVWGRREKCWADEEADSRAVWGRTALAAGPAGRESRASGASWLKCPAILGFESAAERRNSSLGALRTTSLRFSISTFRLMYSMSGVEDLDTRYGRPPGVLRTSAVLRRGKHNGDSSSQTNPTRSWLTSAAASFNAQADLRAKGGNPPLIHIKPPSPLQNARHLVCPVRLICAMPPVDGDHDS